MKGTREQLFQEENAQLNPSKTKLALMKAWKLYCSRREGASDLASNMTTLNASNKKKRRKYC